MIDFDSARWRATRLTFRGGWCARGKGPDCHVPLAFDADDALWHDTAVAIASANQTAAAAATLKAFLRCVVPPSVLLWLIWAMPPPALWARLSEFARVPLPPRSTRSEFPGAAPSTTKGALRPAFVRGCDGVHHGRPVCGRVPRSLLDVVRM